MAHITTLPPLEGSAKTTTEDNFGLGLREEYFILVGHYAGLSDDGTRTLLISNGIAFDLPSEFNELLSESSKPVTRAQATLLLDNSTVPFFDSVDEAVEEGLIARVGPWLDEAGQFLKDHVIVPTFTKLGLDAEPRSSQFIQGASGRVIQVWPKTIETIETCFPLNARAIFEMEVQRNDEPGSRLLDFLEDLPNMLVVGAAYVDLASNPNGS